MGRLLLTCLLALAFVVPVQAGEKMWTKEFNKDVKYKKLTAGGIYLVLTDEGLYGLEPETGNEIWSYTEEELKEDDIEYVEGTPLLLITKGKGFTNRTVNMSVISVMDGTETWKIEGIPGMVVGSQIIFEHGLVLLFTTGGKDGIAIHAYDAIDGAPKYQVAFPEKQEMKKVNLIKPPGAGTFSTKLKMIGHQEPVIDGDHMIMFYDYLRKIDLNTGQMVWMDMSEKKRPKEKDVPMLSRNYAAMQLHDGVLYTPYGKGLAAFDAATGQRKWLIEKVKGEIVSDLHFEGNKLYYRGGSVIKGSGKKAKMLDAVYNGANLADGSRIWEKDVKLGGGVTNWVFTDDKIYVALEDRLYTIDKATGSKGKPEKSDEKFKFKDGAPHTITYNNGNLLVQGGQTVAMYDISGGDIDKELWRQYYKSPGAFGMFAKIAMGAISTMAYMDASARASRSYSGSASNRIANDQRKSAWGSFNKVMNTRVTATASSEKYQYVLTKLDDGEGLVGINLKTGAADREILLKEKKPDYEMDEAAGILFFLKKKELTAFKLD